MNKGQQPFSVRARLQSFGYAFKGVWVLMRGEHNAWVHTSAGLLALAMAAVLGITRLEWALIVLAIATVWVAEALNTAIEYLGDAISRDHHEFIGLAKDVAAGAVLLAAIAAAIIGLLVFGPYLLALLK